MVLNDLAQNAQYNQSQCTHMVNGKPIEDMFPKTQRLTPSIGPKFTSDAITVYRALKATLESIAVRGVNTLAAERLSS